MGRIIWTMVILAVGCCSLGVFIGMRVTKRKYADIITGLVDRVNKRLASDDIQHVGYTPEQMGYDK